MMAITPFGAFALIVGLLVVYAIIQCITWSPGGRKPGKRY